MKRVEVGGSFFIITYNNFQLLTTDQFSFQSSHFSSQLCSSSASSLPPSKSTLATFFLLPRLQTTPSEAMQPATRMSANPVSKLTPLEPARANWPPNSGHSSFTWLVCTTWMEVEDREDKEEIVRRRRDRKVSNVPYRSHPSQFYWFQQRQLLRHSLETFSI